MSKVTGLVNVRAPDSYWVIWSTVHWSLARKTRKVSLQAGVPPGCGDKLRRQVALVLPRANCNMAVLLWVSPISSICLIKL